MRPEATDPSRIDRRKLLLGGTAAAGLVWAAPAILQTTGSVAMASPNSCPSCGTNVLLTRNGDAELPAGSSTTPSFWTPAGNAQRAFYGVAPQLVAPAGGLLAYFGSGNGNNSSTYTLTTPITLTACEQTLVAAGKLSVSMTGLLISGATLTNTATLTLVTNTGDKAPVLTEQKIATLAAATLRPPVSVLLPVGTTTVSFRMDLTGKTPAVDLLQANFVCI